MAQRVSDAIQTCTAAMPKKLAIREIQNRGLASQLKCTSKDPELLRLRPFPRKNTFCERKDYWWV